MKTYPAITLLLFLSGCMLQPPLIKKTASGYPEGSAAGLSVEQMKSAIIAGCLERKLQIFDANSNQVVCGREMGDLESFFSPMTPVSKNSTLSEIKVRFTIYKSGDGVKVVANQWIETPRPFHLTDKREIKSAEVMNDIQQFLFDVGAK